MCRFLEEKNLTIDSTSSNIRVKWIKNQLGKKRNIQTCKKVAHTIRNTIDTFILSCYCCVRWLGGMDNRFEMTTKPYDTIVFILKFHRRIPAARTPDHYHYSSSTIFCYNLFLPQIEKNEFVISSSLFIYSAIIDSNRFSLSSTVMVEKKDSWIRRGFCLFSIKFNLFNLCLPNGILN